MGGGEGWKAVVVALVPAMEMVRNVTRRNRRKSVILLHIIKHYTYTPCLY